MVYEGPLRPLCGRGNVALCGACRARGRSVSYYPCSEDILYEQIYLQVVPARAGNAAKMTH